MSRRTSEANRAIAIAWEREQELVKKGQGTRDWNQEQQKNILERGKAYDENGKAFEGQHMRSAEMHPEEQGNPDNIQFLTREEHLAAHDGSWQNPTNWYYDPVTKLKIDFGDGPIIPCEVIQLSETLPELITIDNGDTGKKHIENEDEKSEPEDGLKQNVEQAIESETSSMKSINDNTTESKLNGGSPIVHKTISNKILDGIGKGLKKAGKFAKRAGKFVIDNKETIIAIATLVGGSAALAENQKRKKASKGSDFTSDQSYTHNKELYVDNTEMNEDSLSCDRNSPQEHTVSPHGQHYHTKDGVIWKEKDAYSRGGKNEDV